METGWWMTASKLAVLSHSSRAGRVGKAWVCLHVLNTLANRIHRSELVPQIHKEKGDLESWHANGEMKEPRPRGQVSMAAPHGAITPIFILHTGLRTVCSISITSSYFAVTPRKRNETGSRRPGSGFIISRFNYLFGRSPVLIIVVDASTESRRIFSSSFLDVRFNF